MDATKWTFDGIGKNGALSLNVEITFDVFGGEDATWDVPATPAKIEVVSVDVLSLDSPEAIVTDLGSWAPMAAKIGHAMAEAAAWDIADSIGINAF